MGKGGEGWFVVMTVPKAGVVVQVVDFEGVDIEKACEGVDGVAADAATVVPGQMPRVWKRVIYLYFRRLKSAVGRILVEAMMIHCISQCRKA